MRRIGLLTIAMFGLTLGTAGADDAMLTKQVVGKWTTCLTGGAATAPDGHVRYAAGGTFAAEGKVALGEGVVADVKVEGTWKVSEGAIVHKVTKSSHPGLAPVGGEMKERIVSIDDKQMRVKRGIAQERERKRVAE